MNHTPYTYYIYHKPTGFKYYGVRFANKCHPDDLWKTYFTSSKSVKSLISKFGKESFDFEIRKIFDCPKKAILWENKVIRKLNLIHKKDWLNQSNGTSFKATKFKTEEHKLKIKNALTGIKRTPEQILKISQARSGTKLSNQTKQKMKQSRKNKVWAYNTITKKTIMIEPENFLVCSSEWVLGKRIFNRTKPTTQETRKKQSLRRKGLYSWISNLSTQHSKQVRKEIIDQYLNSGWILGRKFF